MAKFLLRCAEDVDIFHAAAVIAGSVMRIALEMLLMIRAFGQTHASRYNNLCIISDAVCTISLAWLQSLNVIIDVFTFVFALIRRACVCSRYSAMVLARCSAHGCLGKRFVFGLGSQCQCPVITSTVHPISGCIACGIFPSFDVAATPVGAVVL